MGIFQKPTDIDIALVLPYVQDPVGALVWEVTNSVDGTDTVSVQGYANDELAGSYANFLVDSASPKVLRYALWHDEDSFASLDYVRGLEVRLHPDRQFTNGVITHVDYYADVSFDAYGQEVFDDLIVTEHYDYTRNSDGFAVTRTMTIKWITEAGTEHPHTKSRFKTYSLTESIRETDRRRANILDSLKSSMIGLMVAAMGMTVDGAVQTGQVFFEYHINNIVAFKEIGEVQTLIDAILADDVHPWLDNLIAPPTTTMRQYIASTLSGAILVGT